MADEINPATAAKLLATLERIVALSSRPTPDSTGHNVVKVREALIDEARAVIAAAKGA